MDKKKENVVAETTGKIERINLFKTTYHYFRNWIKYILIDGKVNGFRFVKDEIGWTGNLSVPKSETEKAKTVLKDYKVNNPDTVDLWW